MNGDGRRVRLPIKRDGFHSGCAAHSPLSRHLRLEKPLERYRVVVLWIMGAV